MGIRYEQKAQVYRFGSAVAVSTESTKTVYLTPELALKLAQALMKFAQDIHETPSFPASTLKTILLTEGI